MSRWDVTYLIVRVHMPITELQHCHDITGRFRLLDIRWFLLGESNCVRFHIRIRTGVSNRGTEKMALPPRNCHCLYQKPKTEYMWLVMKEILTLITLRKIGACSCTTPRHYIDVHRVKSYDMLMQNCLTEENPRVRLTTSGDMRLDRLQTLVSVRTKRDSEVYDKLLTSWRAEIQLLQEDVTDWADIHFWVVS